MIAYVKTGINSNSIYLVARPEAAHEPPIFKDRKKIHMDQYLLAFPFKTRPYVGSYTSLKISNKHSDRFSCAGVIDIGTRKPGKAFV